MDITSSLQYDGGTAAATGMIISPNGLVLTNNHVIQDTTGLTATLVSSGQRYHAKWLGYDKSDDVAVIQLVRRVRPQDRAARQLLHGQARRRRHRDRQRRGSRRQPTVVPGLSPG